MKITQLVPVKNLAQGLVCGESMKEIRRSRGTYPGADGSFPGSFRSGEPQKGHLGSECRSSGVMRCPLVG